MGGAGARHVQASLRACAPDTAQGSPSCPGAPRQRTGLLTRAICTAGPVPRSRNEVQVLGHQGDS